MVKTIDVTYSDLDTYNYSDLDTKLTMLCAYNKHISKEDYRNLLFLVDNIVKMYPYFNDLRIIIDEHQGCYGVIKVNIENIKIYISYMPTYFSYNLFKGSKQYKHWGYCDYTEVHSLMTFWIDIDNLFLLKDAKVNISDISFGIKRKETQSLEDTRRIILNA